MLATERQTKIIDLINKNGRVAVDELAHLFNVSAVTIRNDLEILHRNGVLRRIHGGAVRKDFSHLDLPLFEKQKIHIQEKERIGKKAADLVNNGETIIIDSGTTTQFLAKNLAEKKNLTVITHALNIAYELAPYPQIEIIMPGGVLRNNSYSLVGTHAEEFINRLHVHKFFLGVDGFDINYGLTTQNMLEANLNRLMAQNADSVIVLCDSSKFNRRGFAKIVEPTAINIIITDSNVPQEVRDWAARNHVQLIAV